MLAWGCFQQKLRANGGFGSNPPSAAAARSQRPILYDLWFSAPLRATYTLQSAPHHSDRLGGRPSRPQTAVALCQPLLSAYGRGDKPVGLVCSGGIAQTLLAKPEASTKCL